MNAPPPPPESRVVLITGCSSGIGLAAADQLARAGHRVAATARRADSVAMLRSWREAFGDRAAALALDVMSPASIGAAVAEVVRRYGRLDVLVNNAGYGQIGAIEDLDLDAWRAQFETNLFGVASCVRAVLPHMRRQRNGRIINISSAVAHITTPLMGAYCASKHALESLGSALRMETAGTGIHVVMIEPGPVQTEFRNRVRSQFESSAPQAASACAVLYRGLARWWEIEADRGATPADQVARLVRRAVEARRPRLRYRISWQARVVPRLRAFVPDRLVENFLRHGLKKLGRDSA